MLGRKAIHHTARGTKRKWQEEQEKDSGAESSDDGEDEGEEIDAAELLESAQAAVEKTTKPSKSEKPEPEAKVVAEAKIEEKNGEVVKEQAQPDIKKDTKAKEADDDDDDDSDEEGGGKSKAFAWMDSDDEVSDGEEEAPATKAVGSDAKLGVNGIVKTPPQLQDGAKLLSTLRSTTGCLNGPLTVPPGTTALPPLTQDHLALMAQVASAKTLAEFWDLADRRAQDFSPAHSALALHRLSALATANGSGDGSTPELAVERHKSFGRLRDRLDELLATEKGRASFLPADLAMAAASLAKVVPLPATEGATGRIFADVADEAESRILAEPSAFTTSMLADLAWGLSKSGNSKTGFLRTIVDAAAPRLAEATCQDIATLTVAFMNQMFPEAEVILHGLFQQAKQRLGYMPPALESAQPVAFPAQAADGTATPASGSDAAATPSNGCAAAAAQEAEATGASASEAGKAKLPSWQLVGHWRFSCGQISDIACAASRRVGLSDEAIFSLVAQQFIGRMHEFNGHQLVKLRDGFELMRYDTNSEFMRSVRSAQLLPRNRIGFAPPAGPPRAPVNLLDPSPRAAALNRPHTSLGVR